jgi:ankyrin repeat protein
MTPMNEKQTIDFQPDAAVRARRRLGWGRMRKGAAVLLLAGWVASPALPAAESSREGKPETPAPARSESMPDDGFRQALIAEETNPDLEVAARAYREVIAGLDGQRKMAATAILRLGECCRKLGQTNEAVFQFERLCRDFTDQPRVVETAQARLRELAPAKASPMAGARKPLSAEQVKLLREEIRLAESQLAVVEKMISAGRADTSEQSKYQQDILVLKRQLPEFSTADQQRELVDKQIQLAEQRLRELQIRVKLGTAPVLDAAGAERALFSLKREYLEIGQAAPSPTVASDPVSEAERKELQRLQAMIKESPDLINAKDDGGYAPLHYAATQGYLKAVEILLANGADIQAKSKLMGTALHMAVGAGRLAVVELLLARGADPNAVDDREGTPLMLAVRKGFVNIAGVLLKNGAKTAPIIPDKPIDKLKMAVSIPVGMAGSLSPLMLAIDDWNAPLIEALLRGKADVNERSPARRHRTPLNRAIGDRHPEMVELFLKFGADIAGRDEYGRTPLSLAADIARANPADAAPGAIFALLSKNELANRLDRQETIAIHLPARGVPGSENAAAPEQAANVLLEPVFKKWTNTWNQFTLLEAIAAKWPQLASRDLSRVVIQRGTENQTIPVDVAALLKQADRSADVPLAWGDVITIPECPEGAGAAQTGANLENVKSLVRWLSRTVTIKDLNTHCPMVLVPVLGFTNGLVKAAVEGNHVSVKYSDQLTVDLGEFKSPQEVRVFSGLWFSRIPPVQVLYDKVPMGLPGATRIKLIRNGKETWIDRGLYSEYELLWNQGSTVFGDLWLRDGDVIEFPILF